MKKLLQISSVLMFLLINVASAFALEPVLYFSDITSGPKTGLGDGKGSGAIVTIWGVNLGAVQGTSKIYVGGAEASHVYYWGNADTTGASGPADLYTYHKMQTVSFSVASSAADGSGEIYALVGGKKTNSLPFTVRAGNIYFIKTTGSSTGSGSWSSPWNSMVYAGSGAGGTLSPGDIVYVGDNVVETSGVPIKYLVGTAANPFSMIAYPGAHVVIQGSYGIKHWNRGSAYWNFSKFTIKSQSMGIDTFKGMRAVGNEITNYPGGCADGQSGAISGGNSGNSSADVAGGVRAFGNYIHDFGCDTTSKLHHVFYITNRGGFPIESFELGWNYLINNKVHHGLHVYDEGICGDFVGVMPIHDNVVVNQVGWGVDVNSSGYNGTCFSMPVEVYNNLFINVGLEIPNCGGHNEAAFFGKVSTKSHIKFYNNTIYGYGVPGSGAAVSVQGGAGTGWDFGGVWEMKNNIIVDTKNLPYQLTSYAKPADVSSNNLWYNGGDGVPSAPPSWDIGALTSDPLFADSAKGYFNLQIGSSALNAGTDTSPVVTRDFRGIPRGLGKNYSIGAFEYIKTSVPAAPAGLMVE